MAQLLRVIDSGVVEGRMNIALGQALIERHAAGEIPDTLRFLRFAPTALVGRHQALEQEVDIAYCRANDIALVRRITGGGAIYLDPDQLGWELVVNRNRLPGNDLTEIAGALCEASARALQRLGVDARYRPRNDIEVDGRKIGGTGGFFDQDTLFYQGTVLVDLDPSVMTAALRVPRSKLARHDLDSAEQRIVTLRSLLGEACPGLDEIQAAIAGELATLLAAQASPGAMDARTRALAGALYEEEVGQDEFVYEIEAPANDAGLLEGTCSGPGGTIQVYLKLQGPAQNRIGAVLITGDFFITPPRVVYDLEAALRGIFLEEISGRLDCFFKLTAIDSLSVRREDFEKALGNALAKRATGTG